MNIKIVNPIPEVDLWNIVKMHEEDKLSENLKKLGEGSYGSVYLYKSLDGVEYAVKSIHSSNRSPNSRSQDAKNLEALQGLSFIPKLYAYIQNELIIMERIKGVVFNDYIHNNKDCREFIKVSRNFRDIIKKGIKQIDERGLMLYDMHKGNLMINEEGMPIIVDVGHFLKINKSDWRYNSERRELKALVDEIYIEAYKSSINRIVNLFKKAV